MPNSAISYVDKHISPQVGCPAPLLSDGCRFCWARDLHQQRHKAKVAGCSLPNMYKKTFEVLQWFPERLNEVSTWRSPQRVFVGPQTDTFHPLAPAQNVHAVLDVISDNEIERNPMHLFLILTKRATMMRTMMISRRPLANLMLGCSICTQAEAEYNLPILATLAERGFRTWASFEPQLELIEPTMSAAKCLEWIVLGCESGGRARPYDLAWPRALIRWASQGSGVPVFVKQIPSNCLSRPFTEPRQFPEDLQIRNYARFTEGKVGP